MKDLRRVLAAVGAVLGLAGAVGAVVFDPAVSLVSAAGALLAAAAVLIRRSPSADDAAGLVTPTNIAVTRSSSATQTEEAPRSIESAQLATAGAPSPAPPTASRSDEVAGDQSTPSASTPASALTDPVTGLFSQDYFDIAIDARIAAARRHLRPVGVVILEVVEGMRVGRIQVTDPKRVSEAISETLREADTACRRADGSFALLLEDTPENGAIWTVERIRRFLAERDPTLTLWAGVACYPAHGFSSEALVQLAAEALGTAREWHQDRIEVAVSE